MTGALNNSGTVSDAANPDTGGCFVNGPIGTNVTGIIQNSTTESMTLLGQSTFNGPVTLTTSTLTLTSNGCLGNGSYSGAMANGGTFVYSSTNTQTISGVISGTGSLVVSNGGVLYLASANTYTGTTTVSAGSLLVSGSISSPVSVATGGMFGGTGTVAGSVTMTTGSALTFNLSAGAVQGLTVQGNVALSGTIAVTPNVVSGTLAPGNYTILTYTGTLTGSPTFAWLAPVGSPDTATFSTSVGGVVTMTVTVPKPVISGTLSETVAAQAPFTYSISATGDPTSYSASGLPSGLSVNSTTGVISGTPSSSGTYTVTLGATNSGGTGTATLNLTVTPPAPVITSSGTDTATGYLAFNFSVMASNTPGSFSVSGLPAGLKFNTSTGAITGTATETGTFLLTLSATNAYGTGTETLSLTINPPASPWVLSVGGTSLVSGPSGITSETVWNSSGEGNGGATGGGVSDKFERPPWQENVPVPLRQNGTVGRGVPDVAATGWNTMAKITINGQPQAVGGTTVSASVWAGLIALLNQGRGQNLGYLNERLYSEIGPASVLRPITSGDNGVKNLKGYVAAPGWNPVSGWGSPDGTKFLEWLRDHP